MPVITSVSSPRMIRAEVRFTGRVQGVGFRATARSIANQFQITGWVRNEPDGSVLLAAEGEPQEINTFLESLQDQMSRFIRSTLRNDSKPRGESGFEVRR